MDWLSAALASAIVFGLVTVGDKRLLDSYFPSVASFNFMIGIVQGATGLLILFLAFPFLEIPASGTIILGLATGMLWAVGLSLFFAGLRIEEASRATPIFSTFPIFTALFAVLFLNASLTMMQWGSIVLVITGASLISVRASSDRRGIINTKALTLVLVGAIITGLVFVMNKELLLVGNFWVAYGLRASGMGVGFIVLSFRITTASDVRQAMGKPGARNLFLIFELFLATIAVSLQQLAINIGPVSLVSAVTGVRPLAVLGLTMLFSTSRWNFLNEPLDGDTVMLKVLATALTVTGIIGLTVL